MVNVPNTDQRGHRTALSTVVNICRKLTSECPAPIMDAVPRLCDLLHYEDRQLRSKTTRSLTLPLSFIDFIFIAHVLGALFNLQSNIYLKGLLMVHRRMLEISKGSHGFLTDTITEMEAVFGKYWSENSLILACDAILDPRYKVKFVEYCYMKLSATGNVGERVSRVVNTLYCLLAEYKRRSAFLSSPPVGVSGVSTNFASGNDEGDVFGDYNQFLSMSSKSQGSKSELDLYLEEPSYDLNSDLDVLEFWSKSSMRYPVLAVMARDILSVPVSSATLKSAFHMGGKTLSIVSSVMPETIQALVCLQDWIHAQYDSDDFILKGEELSDSSEDFGFDDDDGDSILTESF